MTDHPYELRHQCRIRSPVPALHYHHFSFYKTTKFIHHLLLLLLIYSNLIDTFHIHNSHTIPLLIFITQHTQLHKSTLTRSISSHFCTLKLNVFSFSLFQKVQSTVSVTFRCFWCFSFHINFEYYSISYQQTSGIRYGNVSIRWRDTKLDVGDTTTGNR